MQIMKWEIKAETWFYFIYFLNVLKYIEIFFKNKKDRTFWLKEKTHLLPRLMNISIGFKMFPDVQLHAPITRSYTGWRQISRNEQPLWESRLAPSGTDQSG